MTVASTMALHEAGQCDGGSSPYILAAGRAVPKPFGGIQTNFLTDSRPEISDFTNVASQSTEFPTSHHGIPHNRIEHRRQSRVRSHGSG